MLSCLKQHYHEAKMALLVIPGGKMIFSEVVRAFITKLRPCFTITFCRYFKREVVCQERFCQIITKPVLLGSLVCILNKLCTVFLNFSHSFLNVDCNYCSFIFVRNTT